jgi:hypothetical protein
MTLANMRENGVRLAFGDLRAVPPRRPLMNADAFGDAIAVPSFGPRMPIQGQSQLKPT